MNDSIDLGGHGGQTFQWGGQGTQPGAFVVGKVLALAEVQSTNFKTKLPETWDNGDPKMQYRITLQTDLRDPANPNDDGKRDVYLDGSRKVRDNGSKSRLCAVLEAVRAVTGGTALQVGGFLRLQWVSGMGFEGDPRNYEAQYQAPQIELGQPAQPVVVPQGQPATLAGQPNPFAAASANGSDPFPQGAQPVAAAAPSWVDAPSVQAAKAAQGPTYVNRQTGEVASAEQVAAVKAANLDPAAVFALA